jgi:hypothetical protein
MFGVSEVSIIIEEDANLQESIQPEDDHISFIKELFQTQIIAKVFQHIHEKNSY